jgi:SynChlorMet cassette protein ScmC
MKTTNTNVRAKHLLVKGFALFIDPDCKCFALTILKAKMSNLMNPYIKSYALNLSDGNNWCITCDEQNIQMVDKLSAIMNLRECGSNDLPRLVFSKMEKDRELPNDIIFSKHGLPNYNTGWKRYNFSSQIIRIWIHPDIEDVICEVDSKGRERFEYMNMWYSVLPIYNRSINHAGMPFHAGLAEIDGRGVLFVASGGTGKSTCCRRLSDYWKSLCDDEALVVLNSKKEYRAHPFPTWSEYLRNNSNKTWDVQYSVPLSAIFFLQQADNDEVIPLSIAQSSALITESASQVCIDSVAFLKSQEVLIEFRKKLFNNAFDLAMSVPAFYLRVSLNGSFWKEIEKVIT